MCKHYKVSNCLVFLMMLVYGTKPTKIFMKTILQLILKFSKKYGYLQKHLYKQLSIYILVVFLSCLLIKKNL